MPGRSTPLVTGEFYHVYNRGVADQPTFTNSWEYRQALLAMDYYRFVNPPVKLSLFKRLSREDRANLMKALLKKGDRLVTVIAFVFMPNHFHFLLKQEADNGISTFIGRFINSYTKYFNTRNERFGALFQGVFKSVHVQTVEQLVHLSRYIHLNPVVSHVIGEKYLIRYPWSSFKEYVSGRPLFVDAGYVISHFKSVEDYVDFVRDQVEYGESLERIKHLVLE